ncbi:ImmA/IrrE family metallo-endopeptidase [Sediminicoccus sp. BL-A-41-H5]|uniref:ImmA/IrrE family metallo-endopeptidase n=1 Tax=Sediminicoccus sp. BL-A-41-H5 TaxID=3421106 RepID=UPI003D670B19
MPLVVSYPHSAGSAAPHPLSREALWAVAAQVRRQLRAPGESPAVDMCRLVGRSSELVVNDRPVRVAWELAQAVHDDAGLAVLGVCETDPDMPGTALVSVNGPMVEGRPELALSTAAHELGHALFDVPAALGEAGRRFRAITALPEALLDRRAVLSERRANEFMGALLVPPVPLHLQMLVHARAEGLRTAHAPHYGRQGSRILARGNPSEAVEGVVAALAGDFGVSEGFIRVRLNRYRLVQEGLDS